MLLLVMMVVLVSDTRKALLEWHISHQHFRLLRKESTLVSKTWRVESKRSFLGGIYWTGASFFRVDSWFEWLTFNFPKRISNRFSQFLTTEVLFINKFLSCIHHWGYPCCAEDLQHGRSKQKWILSCTENSRIFSRIFLPSKKDLCLKDFRVKKTPVVCFQTPLRCLELGRVFPDVREA